MNSKAIFIIDYDMGNARSVQNAFNKIDVNTQIVSNPQDLLDAAAIVLPGVGSFKKAIENLKKNGLFKIINTFVLEKHIPYLGICLGMQLIAKDSTENQRTKGFGWLNAKVRRIEIDKNSRLPHVGWNQIEKTPNTILLSRIETLTHYYFDHSFALICKQSDYISSEVKYGGKSIVASVEKGHIFGTQFHPEKSQINGLRVLKAFAEYTFSK